ncbi:redoxin domain-containing protein [Arthrobacter alpinus]|nr:redoxin domain-containing protein [Arthrobacter alpinus]
MKIDEKVADFSLLDQHGVTRSLSELTANGPLVIFFYPWQAAAVAPRKPATSAICRQNSQLQERPWWASAPIP